MTKKATTPKSNEIMHLVSQNNLRITVYIKLTTNNIISAILTENGTSKKESGEVHLESKTLLSRKANTSLDHAATRGTCNKITDQTTIHPLSLTTK